MEHYFLLGITIVSSILVSCLFILLISKWISKPFPRKKTSSEITLLRYRECTDKLWKQSIKQLKDSSSNNEDLAYWIPALKKLKQSDAELFHVLEKLSARNQTAIVRLIDSSGLAAFTEKTSTGTPTSLILKALKKGNKAIAESINNLGLVKRRTLAWVKTFCETKANFLENVIDDLPKGE